MQTITIPASVVPPRATYVRNVLTGGHAPGVLSGANLRGKAKRYASYWQGRARAVQIAADYGVERGLVLIDSRWAAVWTLNGERVQIDLVAQEG